MTIGQRLKKARNDRKYTQQYMADNLGIAKSTYCGYESDFRKPDVLTVQRIASLLGVSGSYIIGSDDAVVQPNPPDVLYVSVTSGNPSTDELRKYLHDIIDQLPDDDLRLLKDMTLRIQR